MPITFDCACGKTLRVPDANAGRRVKCPACAAVSTVPQPEPQFEVVEEPPEPPVPKARPVAKPATSRNDDDDDDDDRAYSVKKKSSRRDDDDDEEEEEEKPRKKKKKRRERPPEDDSSSGGGGAGVAGGILMMLIAAVWFIVGIVAADRIFIYPPILFVLGLIAFFKGLAGGE